MNVETKQKRGIRASVRLTEEAHQLLLDIARANKESMKHIGSKAIFVLDKKAAGDEAVGERIEQLKFKALKFKQMVALYIILVCIGSGLIGFIMGLMVR